MTISNVHLFPGVKPKEATTLDAPNIGLVAMLKEALVMAEAGRLQSFIGSGFTCDHQRLCLRADPVDSMYVPMLGAIELDKQEYLGRLARRMDLFA